MSEIAFEVGAMTRDELEDKAADLGLDFTKHTPSEDLRTMILDALIPKQD